MHRRTLLKGSLASALAAALAGPARSADGDLAYGKPAPMSWDLLRERARALAGVPYAAPATADAAVLQSIDYDAHGKIRYRTDKALFQDGEFPVTFFHPGRYFQKPVRMHVLDGDEAREILYDPAGLFTGPGWADLHGTIPLLTARAVVTAVAAFLAFLAVDRGSFSGAIGAGLVLPGSFALLGRIVPGVMQSLSVQPSELSREGPQIIRHIEATRAAIAVSNAEPPVALVVRPDAGWSRMSALLSAHARRASSRVCSSGDSGGTGAGTGAGGSWPAVGRS